MDIRYRLFDGSVDDAAGVLEVEAACWNESSHSPQTLLEILSSGEWEQVCWLAESMGQVVGFVHAFLTHGVGGGATWEVDLLAVAPGWRRRGAATELIRRAVSTAPGQAARGRALVATHNEPSAKAFSRAGFAAESVQHGIYVLDVTDSKTAWPDGVEPGQVESHTWRVRQSGREVHLQEVRTVLYSGLWVDGFAGQMPVSLLHAALLQASRRGLDVVGVVIPLSDLQAVRALKDAGYESIGSYRVWTCPLPAATGRSRER